MTFSTIYTAPRLVHVFLDGSSVTLVSNGRVMEKYQRSGSHVTSVAREQPYYGGYVVTVNISNVVEQDAGTYVAADDNGLSSTIRNYAEFIVTGMNYICTLTHLF